MAGLCTVDAEAVIIEAVKAAEDGSGDVIMRLYESYGGGVVDAALCFGAEGGYTLRSAVEVLRIVSLVLRNVS